MIGRRLKVPVILICHNVLPHEPFPMSEALARLMLRAADAFIVQSERDLRDLRRLKPDSHIVQTSHPSYAALAGRRWSTEDARRQLGIDGSTVLQFGFVRQYKGLDCLIRAVHLARNEVTVNILVVGEFWVDKGPYLRLVRELGLTENVTFIDRYVPNEELGLYFGAADAVVLPYLDATQSGVLQLAYAFRKPVIGSSVGGLGEAIDDGKTGILVEPGNAQSLARGLVRLLRATDVDWAANIAQTDARFAWGNLVELIGDLATRHERAGPCAH